MKKKFFGVLLIVLALFALTACTSLSGKYYKINESSSGAYEGFDDDTYFNFTDKSFTAISDGNEEGAGVIDNDKSTLISGQFVLTYTLKDDVLTVTDGKDTAKYVQKDSDLYHSLSKKNIAKKNAEWDLKSAEENYEKAFEKVQNRVVLDFKKKYLGTYRNNNVEVVFNAEEFSYKSLLNVSSSSDTRTEKYKISIVSTQNNSDEFTVKDWKTAKEEIDKIKTWSDYIKYNSKGEISIKYGGDDLDNYEIYFTFDKNSQTLTRLEDHHGGGPLAIEMGFDSDDNKLVKE